MIVEAVAIGSRPRSGDRSLSRRIVTAMSQAVIEAQREGVPLSETDEVRRRILRARARERGDDPEDLPDASEVSLFARLQYEETTHLLAQSADAAALLQMLVASESKTAISAAAAFLLHMADVQPRRLARVLRETPVSRPSGRARSILEALSVSTS